MRTFSLAVLMMFFLQVNAQQTLGKLTVEKIMSDPKWIGTSPSNANWSADSKTLYFYWNPDNSPADSLYSITSKNKTPVKVAAAVKKQILFANSIINNNSKSAYVFAKDGDIFFTTKKDGKTKRIVSTSDMEYNPVFSFNDTRIVYTRNQNLYAWDINTGETTQLTKIQTGNPPVARGSGEKSDGENQQEKWLQADQLKTFEILQERKTKREATESYNKNLPKEKELKTIYIGDKSIQNLSINASGKLVSYRLFKPASSVKGTIVPNYITETGFTTDLTTRAKVGEASGTSEMFVYDRTTDTLYAIKTDDIPGIKDLPDYAKDYPMLWEEKIKKPTNRAVNFSVATWSPAGENLLLDIRSQDNKDRWLMVWEASTRKIKWINRQRDEAWVGGTGFLNRGWLNDTTIWFQSEATGYSHLYTTNINTGLKKQLTAGNYEVQEVELSKDNKYFYITSNEVHPGEKHFNRLPVTGGKAMQLTSMEGNSQVSLSPDEKTLAFLHSYSTKPNELYWQENAPGKKPIQVTNKARSEVFKSYQWKDPEVISIKARDGAAIYARVYKPTLPHPARPAVIFVHGAGYLQNAHKWWSTYFREYMFHNLLVDEGYTVMEIDYRGSAGYGRDWRTGIYRFMGGKDLTDHVDAADYLVKNLGVDAGRIGIYGGSYGGFITLMGMFTTPGVFAAGAALRPVTDWANYNHGYTSAILNEPFNDSIAYRRSSPLYYANGLRGNLLICHGMVDVNVHFQDVVKLSQRLIELKKDNWELAVYPVEDHGFTEPNSWTDEYKRIFKLFETVLKK